MITVLLGVGVIFALYLVVSSWFTSNTGRRGAAALQAFMGATLGLAVLVAVFYLKAKGMIE